jgi:hypothetical protein
MDRTTTITKITVILETIFHKRIFVIGVARLTGYYLSQSIFDNVPRLKLNVQN